MRWRPKHSTRKTRLVLFRLLKNLLWMVEALPSFLLAFSSASLRLGVFARHPFFPRFCLLKRPPKQKTAGFASRKFGYNKRFPAWRMRASLSPLTTRRYETRL
jgi:hypothetical protein